MSNKSRNIVGPQVRRFRTQRELSQAELSVQLQLAGFDVGRVGLAKIESQIKKVSDAELFILAKVLVVKIEHLFPSGERVKRFLVSAVVE